MKRFALAGITATLVLLLFAFSTGAFADDPSSTLPGIGPGVQDAVNATPDGGTLFVPAVVVSCIHLRGSQWWTVKDSEDGLATLKIAGAPPSEIRLGETVDVQGQLYWENGQPCLSNARCWAYTDSAGNILYSKDFPLMRCLMTEPWPYTVELAVPNTLFVQSFGNVRAQDDDGPPGGGGSDSAGIVAPIYCDTLAAARALYDPNNRVMVELDCCLVQDPSSSTFTLVQYDGSDSIPVYYTGSANLDPTDMINVITAAIQADSTGSNYWLEVDCGPNYGQDAYPGTVLAVPDSATIPYTLTALPMNSSNIMVDGVLVTANGTDFPRSNVCAGKARPGTVRFDKGYDEQRVHVGRGQVVDIEGSSVSIGSDGEAVINASSVTADSAGFITMPSPLGMSNRALGGGQWNHYVPTTDADSSGGPTNRGQLVRLWGTVTAVNAAGQYFYIDDGCGLSDSSGNTGVKVSWAWSLGIKPAIIAPALGSSVAVTGISGSESAGNGLYRRVLRPRDENDVTIFAAPPTVTITTPPDGSLHLASGYTTTVLVGTATATGSMASVQVKIDTGNWANASVTGSSSVIWTYNWTNISAASHTITVMATDNAGHTAITSAGVTVSTVNVIYVDSAGNDSNDSSSWNQALQTISQACSNAEENYQNYAIVSEIWVAGGTYNCADEPYSYCTSLYGGFSGTENAREQRNWVSYPTILDGHGAGAVLTVYNTTYGASGLTVDGFTIQNGYNNASAAAAE